MLYQKITDYLRITISVLIYLLALPLLIIASVDIKPVRPVEYLRTNWHLMMFIIKLAENGK